jgi:molecular chaperone DnaK
MTNNYYTVVHNQKSVEITAYQGENPSASKNTLLGSFILKDLPPKLPAGSEIAVTFEYNLNGIVEISALERQSGHKRQLKVDIHRLDVKEEEEQGPPEPGVEMAAGEKINRRKVERVLKKAGKMQKNIDDAEILAELDKRIANLEKALENNDKNTEILAEELAGFTAEL